MKKVLIWGAGYYSHFIYEEIDRENCEVLGIIDNAQEKWDMIWEDNIKIYSPDILKKTEFDYIIISVHKYMPIVRQCYDLGIGETKVIVYWQDDTVKEIFQNRTARIYNLRIEVKKYQIRLENIPYELGIIQGPKIESAENLLKHIIKENCSLSRFGDGEFEMILKRERPWFQRVNDRLAQRLQEVLHSQEDGIVLAIADNFGNLSCYTEDAADNIREYMSGNTRQEVLGLLDLKRVYYDAYVTRPYIIYKDKHRALQIFKLFKEVWRNRNVILVEGAFARIGVGNDLLETAKTVRRVVCPSKNAWDKYDHIFTSVKGIACKDDLICVSLGPTATVLAYDLYKEGLQTIDIGQLDNEYDWYCKKAKHRIDIKGKMVAEVKRNCIDEMIYDEIYENQIVLRLDK